MNISVLRHGFDRLAGLAVTRALVTPKRPKALPEVLSREETLALLKTHILGRFLCTRRPSIRSG